MARVLLITGGSGGHLFPLVAILRAIKEDLPDAETLFVCTDDPREKAWIAHEDVGALRTVPAVRAKNPLSWLRNARAARALLEEFRPDAVVSKGGASSIPLCRMAHARKIPVVLHESDAVMGRANALVARFADAVCLGTEIGNPVRPGIPGGKKEEGLRIAGLDGKKPVLLVLGGSQGAAALNDAVRANIDVLLPLCDVIHVTGEGKRGADPRPGYFSLPFAREELPHLYAASSLALSRAGAGLIAELSACGIPAILVPLEGLAQDHQTANARAAAARGGCVLLRQGEMAGRLTETVGGLLSDAGKLREMGEAMRKNSHPDAAHQITKMVAAAIAGRRGAR